MEEPTFTGVASALEREKKDLAVKDPVFKNAGRNPGVEVFRLDKSRAIQITEPSKFGKFYSSDFYVVVYTERETNGATRWEVHLWQGKAASADDAAFAKLRASDLEDALGPSAVQQRQREGYESPHFLNLFRTYGGVRYLEAGYDLNLKKGVRPQRPKRLLHVTGKHTVRVTPVPVTSASLAQDGVFVLDCGMKIYQWNGKASSKAERAKALDVVRDIRDTDYDGVSRVVVIDEENDKDVDTDFFAELGVKSSVVPTAANDAAKAWSKVAPLKLYKASAISDAATFTEVASAPLKRDLLESADVYVLPAAHQFFLWVGRKVPKDARPKTWDVATAFASELRYSPLLPVTRVFEGTEPQAFAQQFDVWPAAQLGGGYLMKRSSSNFVTEQKASDKASQAVRKETLKLFDDGRGKRQVWRVDAGKKVPVVEKLYGQFYSGDAYVVQYNYKDAASKENYVVYYWLGKDASEAARTAAPTLAKEVDAGLGGTGVLSRIVQGREPDHFLAVFNGKVVVHKGSMVSPDTTSTRLYHVFGTSAYNTRAIQVEATAKSFNSYDTFVLVSPKNSYAWLGKNATGDERAAAGAAAETLAGAGKFETLFETNEPKAFWDLLGGKTDYSATASDVRPDPDARLYQCLFAGGQWSTEEIYGFSQENLHAEDIYVLDAGFEVDVWVGRDVSEALRKAASDAGMAHLSSGVARRTDTSILIVKQGAEPRPFTAHFATWVVDPAVIAARDYPAVRKAVEKGNTATGLVNAEAAIVAAKQRPPEKFPVARLQQRPLPDAADPAVLENHMLEADFPKTFSMTQAEFMALPKWKREEKKKAQNLF